MSSSPSTKLSTTCCVVGGGPAGMMLGFLLARTGVKVMVLEKHKDFLRDFRGDTIHPSTLELMSELQLLDEFLKLPHQEITQLTAQIGDDVIPLADFSHLPTKCKFIAFMPQWDFLNFLADKAKRYPTFNLQMEAEVTDLMLVNDRVTGVIASSPSGTLEITADLTVGADGRHSTLRTLAGLTVKSLGAPIDVLWFRIRRRPEDPREVFGRFADGKVMVMLNRGDYWQCGFVIAKGEFENVKRRGLEKFQQDIVSVASFLGDRVGELRDWDQLRLLTVVVDRLLTWYRDGLLCIGDSAHAMSPIGGVGINLAIQDAVAAANILGPGLLNGTSTTADLARVQKRRQWPARVTQAGQIFIQKRVLGPAIQDQRSTSGLWLFKLFRLFPVLRRIPAYMVGIGARAEHVK